MYSRQFLKALLFAFLFAGLSLPAQELPAPGKLQHIHFQATDALIQNPGEGWMVDPGQPARLPNSIVYVRFDWAQAEPKDGTFDWTFIDDAIAEARRHGATIAMRVMTANAHSEDPYSSPKWLFDEGCKSYAYTNDGSDASQGGRPMQRFEPNYGDRRYLAKHAAFLRALGARYNGNPAVEFLDIGSYGIWGEWHSPHPVSVKIRKKIVDMYLHAFSKTPLVYMSDDAEVMSYALAHGAGLRRDGVGDPWHEKRWAGTPAYEGVPAMGDAWKHAPIVFEWFLNYDYMRAKGWSFESAVNFMLDNHVSVIHDNLGAVPPEAQPLIERLARRAGYRFALQELTAPTSAHPGETIKLVMRWSNSGVARLYRPASFTLRLRNAAGNVVSSRTPADVDPSTWLPGDVEVAAKLDLLAGLAPADYMLEVSITDRANQRPPLRLAFEAPEQDSWYTLAKITIE